MRSTYLHTNQELVAASRAKNFFLAVVQSIVMQQRPLNLVNVSTILQKAGKLRIRLDDLTVSYLVRSLQQLPPDETMTGQHVGNSLYGLQGLLDSPAVRELLLELASAVRRCGELLSSQAVGNALYGLQKLEDSAELRHLLTVLAEKVAMHSEPLNGQAIGNALYGMQRFGDSLEARRLLAVLTPKIEQFEGVLSGQMVGNAVYGLQRFGDSREVRELLATLTPLVRNCADELKPHEICIAVRGLQNLGDTEEARQLLAGLAEKMQQVPQPSHPSKVGGSMHGLQSLDGLPFRDELDGTTLCNIIIGLGGFGDSREMRQMLTALRLKVDQNKPGMTNPRVLGRTFYGLGKMADSKEAFAFISLLINSMHGFLVRRRAIDVSHVFIELRTRASQDEVKELLATLTSKVQICNACFVVGFLEDIGTLNDIGDVPSVAHACEVLKAKFPAGSNTPTISKKKAEAHPKDSSTTNDQYLRALYYLFSDEESLFTFHEPTTTN
jgi:hypothetical protein